ACRFDVETQDAGMERLADLGRALAHSGENNASGIAACSEHPRKLAPRNDIEAAAETGEQAQDGEIRVGLGRVADEMRDIAEGPIERSKCIVQRSPRIYVARCAKPLGYGRERHLLNGERSIDLMQKGRVTQA